MNLVPIFIKSIPSILFCKICETKVNSDKKFNVSQYLKTDKHLEGINPCKEQIQRKQQQLITVNISKKPSFNKDLCEADMYTIFTRRP